MQNDKMNEFKVNVVAAGLVGLLAFSGYQLGKLSCEWAVEGVRWCKSKKNQKM